MLSQPWHRLGLACRLPLLITEICMPFWAFTFGRQRTRFTCPRPVLYVNLLFININYGGQCVCVVIVDAMRCVIARCPRAVGVVIKSRTDRTDRLTATLLTSALQLTGNLFRCQDNESVDSTR